MNCGRGPGRGASIATRQRSPTAVYTVPPAAGTLCRRGWPAIVRPTLDRHKSNATTHKWAYRAVLYSIRSAPAAGHVHQSSTPWSPHIRESGGINPRSRRVVGASGIEPPTPTMSRWCSTTELRACKARISHQSATPAAETASIRTSMGYAGQDNNTHIRARDSSTTLRRQLARWSVR